jgi:lipid-binding SYLF domain-containing protein
MLTHSLIRSRLFGCLVLAVIIAAELAVSADAERLKNAEGVLTAMAAVSDKGVPPELFKKARCLAIVPSVRQAALGFGGKYGKGYLSCRRAGGGWSAPGAIGISGGSVGLQIGGSATDVLLLVMNDQGMTHLLSSKFTVGAEASVAAGPVGRDASAQTDVTLHAEILAWSRSRGAFIGIALEGATLSEDRTENKALYGKEIANTEIVRGSVPVPAIAQSFIAALSKY